MNEDNAEIRPDAGSTEAKGTSGAAEEKAPDEFLTSIDFLEDGEPEPTVTMEMAKIDFKKMLKAFRVLRKTIQKAKAGKRNKQNRDEFEECQSTVLDAIMYGQLVVHGDPIRGVTMTHHLLVPTPGYETLEYKKIPKLVDMRKMDGFDENQGMAQVQGLAAAMSGKAIPELAGLSTADLDVLAALAYFFG